MGMKILTEISFSRSFSQRIINEWNRLSADCVGASSVNKFKTYLKLISHSTQGFAKYVKLYCLQSYQVPCTIQDCYVYMQH